MIEPKYLRELADKWGGVFMEGEYGFETPLPKALTDSASEIELLRAVIKSAPHGVGCHVAPGTTGNLSCDCWKSDVL